MSTASHRFDNAKRYRTEQHVRQAMLTPDYVLEPVRELLGGIDLDPCTEPDNPTCAAMFYHLPDDGASLPWIGERVFCNPPYGKPRDRWVSRCVNAAYEGKRIVLLIPAHMETRTSQTALWCCNSVLLIRARLRFTAVRDSGAKEAASHGSALFGFNVDLSPLSPALGVVLTPTPPKGTH